MFAHAQTAGLFSHEISCRDPYVEPFLDRGSIPLTSTSIREKPFLKAFLILFRKSANEFANELYKKLIFYMKKYTVIFKNKY